MVVQNNQEQPDASGLSRPTSLSLEEKNALVRFYFPDRLAKVLRRQNGKQRRSRLRLLRVSVINTFILAPLHKNIRQERVDDVWAETGGDE